jgi:hypothetical protein
VTFPTAKEILNLSAWTFQSVSSKSQPPNALQENTGVQKREKHFQL